MSALLGLVAVLALGAGASATARPKAVRCAKPLVKSTVVYARRRGAPPRGVTVCGPRVVTPAPVRASLPAVLVLSRRQTLLLTPKGGLAALRTAAARKARRADPLTDRATAAWMEPGARAERRAGRAAMARSSVTSGTDNGPASGVDQGPAGTTTTMVRSGSEWSDASPDGGDTVSTGSGPEANPGFDKTITTTTTTSKAAGASSTVTKRMRIKVRLSRCPDPNGVGTGPVLYEEERTEVIARSGGGRTLIHEVSTYTGTLTAQFGDDAHLTSVKLDGDWTFKTSTRSSARAGGPQALVASHGMTGTASDTRLGPGPESLGVKLGTASDDSAAASATPAGTWIAGVIPPAFARESVDRLERNALDGTCVSIKVDPGAVELDPGASVALSASLHHAIGPPAGRVTVRASAGTITPDGAQADPNAAFTYTAAQGKHHGDSDYVRFEHVSRRGRAQAAVVSITYKDPPPSHTYQVLGARFDQTVTAQRPGSSFPGCPDFSGTQIETMTLGPQPAPTAFPFGPGHLLEGPQGWIGTLGAGGFAAAGTVMHGCLLSSNPLTGCVNTGEGQITRDVRFEVVSLPKAGPALIRWFFVFGPTAGLGSEGAGSNCLSPPLGWTTDNFALGDQTVPREVFEAATPQRLDFGLDFDLTDPNPAGAAQIHSGQRFSMTIQRVRDDGSPL